MSKAAKNFDLFVGRDLDDAGLSLRAFRLLCHIARWANKHGGGWCDSSYGQIVRVCKMGRKSVAPAIAELELAGLIEVDRRSRERGGNRYRFNPAVPQTGLLDDGSSAQNGSAEDSAVPQKESSSAPNGSVSSAPNGPYPEPSRTIDQKEGEGLFENYEKAWNEIAGSKGETFSRLRKMTPQRIAAIRNREKADPEFFAHWHEAVTNMATHPHYRGENDDGWTADFDFLFQTKRDRVNEMQEKGCHKIKTTIPPL